MCNKDGTQDSRAGSGKKSRWYSLMDKVWSIDNLEAAFRLVKKNKGAAGVDRVSIKEYEVELERNLRTLQSSLRKKEFKARPVRRVYIPKDDNQLRPLGIPTVEDRIVQAALKLKLEPIFDEKFLPCSFGFRPGLNAHMAVEQIRNDLMDGYFFVIDADIKTYFDSIPHDKLIELFREEVVDGSIIALIRQFLEAGVLDANVYSESVTGSPQGGVISPLLANIYLHPLDEMMTGRGHRITRYADDFVICCKSQKGAERVLKSVTRLLEGELGLTIHPGKTRIVDNRRDPFTFLGFTFVNCRSIRPSEKALGRFKTKIKEVTKKNMTVDVEHHIKFEVNPIIRGWGNYFGIAAVKRVFETLDAWIRRRLRMVQFRSWRKKKKLHKELRRNNWKGPMPDIRMTKWRSSRSRPAHIAIPNERFRQYQLVFLLDIYKNLHPQRG